MAGKTAGNESGQKRRLIPFDTIAAAVSGDEEAICAVVAHYDRYITKLAARERIDADGGRITYIDEDLRRRLITKLITGISRFRMDRKD